MSAIKRINKMRDPEGFTDLWEKKIRDGKSYEQAYYELEEEYCALIKDMGLEDVLDTRRYSSYDSFRISKNRRASTN